VGVERKLATVLFVDLVGSTALVTGTDPEVARRRVQQYFDRVQQCVITHGGIVEKFAGDAVMAAFGIPQAHEDDAERAVRAGLGLLEAVASLEARPDAHLQARVGIATGQVVVGHLISQGAADPDSVSGDAPNVAARLQALAPRGTVVIAEATRRLIGGLFELDDLGPQRLKGFDEPLAVWRVTAESRAEGRFEAHQTTRLSPLVGRDEELFLLLRRWRQAVDGDGQVVLLSGEPGIGKSRLVREVGERLEGSRTFACYPSARRTPRRARCILSSSS
jgi:class 3 adenylate cyclase